MAKQRGKIKPLFPQTNFNDISLNDLLAISGTNDFDKSTYSDSDIETPFGVLKIRRYDDDRMVYEDSMPLMFDGEPINEAMNAKDSIKNGRT